MVLVTLKIVYRTVSFKDWINLRIVGHKKIFKDNLFQISNKQTQFTQPEI